MNKWFKKIITSLFIISQLTIIPVLTANASVDNQTEKEKVEIEVKKTQKEIDQKLSEASEITMALEELSKDIEEQENLISETEKEIAEQEILVEERYNHTAEQLKTMQKTEVNQNIVVGLFQSESFSDFINRLYTASVLTNASEELLTEAHGEYEKLDDMKEELVLNKKELDSKNEETSEQKNILDQKLSGLKTKLADNQVKLDEIKAEEAKKAKKAKENKEKEAKVSVASSSKKVESSSSSADSSGSTSSTDSSSSTSSSSSKGSWMNFQSTGYSTQQAGLSTHTATGIDLRVNPRVIAVDPSQIPLNSLVEIEGMGVYVAGDTGGAINGKIIDVHFSTVSQALSWGRRNVRIRILN